NAGDAVRICNAKFGTLFLSEGDAFRTVALHGAPPAYDNEHGASTREIKNGIALRIVHVSRLCPNVGNLYRLFRYRGAAASGSWVSTDYWFAPPRFGDLRGRGLLLQRL